MVVFGLGFLAVVACSLVLAGVDVRLLAQRPFPFRPLALVSTSPLLVYWHAVFW